MSNWVETPLSAIASKEPNSFIDGDWIETPFITDRGIRLVQTGNIGVGIFKDSNKKYISEESFRLLNCKEVFPGDILICRLADPIGRSCVMPKIEGRFITSVDVVIFRVDKRRFSRDFMVHCLNTREFLLRAELLSAGSTRQRISRTNLGEILIKHPLLPVQNKIAKIFNTIDGVIENTRKNIEKLKKIKHGMMHDLFTRGIDIKTGQLRPPQSEAPELYKNTELGWIPKDWKRDDLERFSSFAGGNGFSELLQGRKKGDFPFYKVSDMNLPGNEKYLKDANNYVMKNDVTNKGWVIAPAEGVAFAKVGAALLLNRRRILCVDCLVDNNMMVAVAREGCFFLWLYWWLLQVDFSMFVQPGAVPSVNQSQLKKLKISIPSDIEEQKAIADSLESIDKRELAERSTLSKTILLKHGLMQNLLTGKVSVVPDPQDKEYQGAN